MSSASQFRTANPRIIRLELANLRVGDDACAVQLDGIPCEAWVHAFTEALSRDSALAGATVDVNGSWLHLSGIRKSGMAVAPRVVERVAAASEHT
ncbi:hypothetical protein CLM74_10915 [Stenotrophomonas sp. MYb57]|uniref:hypothetical protein n=1 Tax=Stenotrophomonas sp. MYb57 TaxID=1827305 RepID=UPI000CF65194|nr:hypothetical protein [Stenotrophomonas sp. MYb57]AVJ33242.1 hypothetical protein CLM74_10915 [Stenotrophomonas sp. MYb57]